MVFYYRRSKKSIEMEVFGLHSGLQGYKEVKSRDRHSFLGFLEFSFTLG